MSTLPVVSYELTTAPLASVADDRFEALCAEIGRDLRSPSWISMLAHPTRRVGVAAYADGELVGVARIWYRDGDLTDVYVAVTPPWRHLGVGSRLAHEAAAIVGRRGMLLAPRVEGGASVHQLRPPAFARPIRAAS